MSDTEGKLRPEPGIVRSCLRTPSVRERWLALAVIAAAALLRLPYVVNHRFNSDETQHMHVVWGWTKGLVPYRDLFDNHAPLFHAALAPLLALVGERPDALYALRAAMLPLWALALWLTWRIGRSLFAARVALWGTALAAVHYQLFFLALEVRPDVLWTVLWLAVLAVLVGGRPGPLRALAAGLLTGAAAATSVKTSLLVLSLAAAAALVVLSDRDLRRQARPARVLGAVAAFAAGASVVPVSVALWLAGQGALESALDCTLRHNALLSLVATQNLWQRAVVALGLPLMLWKGLPVARRANPQAATGVTLLLTTVVVFFAVRSVAWPILPPQDWLPMLPLAALLLAASAAAWEAKLSARGLPSRRPRALLAALLAAELVALVGKGPPWRDKARPAVALVAETLRLTDADDPVLDTKGETVFRRRCTRPVLEVITLRRVALGLLPDRVVEDVVAARCAVAVPDSDRFSERTRAFLDRGFVSIGALRVAGVRWSSPVAAGQRLPFETPVSARYRVVAPGGPVTGTLDGQPLTGARDLAAGSHELVPDAAHERLAVIWAQAAERGFSPF